eukprot:13632974-Alexandrium_andersonii.AAC.1
MQLSAFLGALSQRLRAPKGRDSCTQLPNAAESCMLQLSAASGCIQPLGLLGGAHKRRKLSESGSSRGQGPANCRAAAEAAWS